MCFFFVCLFFHLFCYPSTGTWPLKWPCKSNFLSSTDESIYMTRMSALSLAFFLVPLNNTQWQFYSFLGSQALCHMVALSLILFFNVIKQPVADGVAAKCEGKGGGGSLGRSGYHYCQPFKLHCHMMSRTCTRYAMSHISSFTTQWWQKRNCETYFFLQKNCLQNTWVMWVSKHAKYSCWSLTIANHWRNDRYRVWKPYYTGEYCRL